MWDFMNTEWFVPEVDNWHIRDDAPQEIKDEFEEYKRIEKESKENGIIID